MRKLTVFVVVVFGDIITVFIVVVVDVVFVVASVVAFLFAVVPFGFGIIRLRVATLALAQADAGHPAFQPVHVAASTAALLTPPLPLLADLVARVRLHLLEN